MMAALSGLQLSAVNLSARGAVDPLSSAPHRPWPGRPKALTQHGITLLLPLPDLVHASSIQPHSQLKCCLPSLTL